ncbi:hypothetical protein G6F55_011660 [Rhizopus delemar]|uniref:Uncharacterized protein n=2 Tax=Rhizopus TaxID=4842 RepID=A0A9P6XYU7_RHIOR|nr:hypothetical protein G6F36_012253 [Rhizopus arrhizus]KAG1446156.1 hypothetical protein G6F55_011660 [Rhizopus delemar]KAG1499061.1 hypothetical protein G6F53_011596 [Rhizopus delemar]KAG1534899.1 hypothetical protein G6F51_011831 [Rhizopus arrhizus]KAG1540746.1 hypothetical protein G6F49_012050 [Rhizopus delemar]
MLGIHSDSHLDWFYDHTFEGWVEFKAQITERFQKDKIKINNVLSAILGIKKKSNETMRQYVDRFDHLVGVYNRQRKVKKDWSEISSSVLMDTFVNGIGPATVRMLIKQHVPKTLSEAQVTAIRECEEEEESDSESNLYEEGSEDDGEEEIIIKKKNRNAKDIKEVMVKEKARNQAKKVKPIKVDKNDVRVEDVDRKIEELTKSFQNFTLFVENGGLEQFAKNKNQQCFNCQDYGTKGRHSFWKCPDYVDRRSKDTYLVTKSPSVFNKQPIETYAADKRLRNDESELDHRVSRSGKKTKALDTVSKELANRRNEMKSKRKELNDVSNSSAPIAISPNAAKESIVNARKKKHSSNRKSQASLNMPSDSITAEDILKAKVFNVSLEQLMPLKGLRSQIIQRTKRVRRSNKKINASEHNEGEVMEAYHVAKNGRIRMSTDADEVILGAPRVTAVVGGCMAGDGILDPGSHGSIISKRLADELQIKIEVNDELGGNKLADGSVIKPLGEVKNLLISVQGVMIKITPVVFENPPYDLLLGSESLQVLSIAVDYARGHFSINTDKRIEPLLVRFKTDVERMKRIEGAEVQSGFDQSQSEDENEFPTEDETEEYETEESEINDYDSEEGSESHESYLIFPVFEDDEEDDSNETYLNGFEEGENLVKNNPTPPEEIKSILEQQVQALDLAKEEKEALGRLLVQFLDVFGLDYNDLKQTNLVKFHVDTGDHQPIMKRPNRHMSHSELETFKKELEKMLANSQVGRFQLCM